MTKPASYLDIESNDTAPHSGADATYIQKISSQVGGTRDRAIVSRVSDALNEFSAVLVVYGGSHLLVQQSALEKMMNRPEYLKWF